MKKNVHSHHSLGKMVKKKKKEEYQNKNQFFLVSLQNKFFYLSYFLSTFDESRMKGINPGIITWCYFSFLFYQRAFGNFLFRRKDRFVCRCWLGVPICIHSHDRISLI